MLGSLSLSNAGTGPIPILLEREERTGVTEGELPGLIFGTGVDTREVLTADSRGCGESRVVASLKLMVECFLTICLTMLLTTHLRVGCSREWRRICYVGKMSKNNEKNANSIDSVYTTFSCQGR